MRLLALVDSPEHVCCRYRIRAFEAALNRAGWSLVCSAWSKSTFARVAQLRDAENFDAVVLQRKLLPPWQLRILRRYARHLVFDFDDAVLFRDSYDRRGPESAWREHRFAATVRSADVVIAGNDFLADCALRAGATADNVRLIPTCVDARGYPVEDTTTTLAVNLVWIGSSSTLQGLELRSTLWDRLGREIPGLGMRIICDRFPRFESMPVTCVNWTHESEGSDIAAGQIGVSWLPDDVWSRGKCGLKVLQYQAAGLPVVANPVGMNSELVEPGVTGFLPATDDGWVEAVRTLAVDPELRRAMGRRARERMESEYSVRAWTDTFVAAVTGIDRPSRPAGDRPPPRGGFIPEPFFVRLRRAGLFRHASQSVRYDGQRNTD